MYYGKDWPERRRQRLEIDGYRCRLCNRTPADGIRLEVHHSTYERFHMEDVDHDLITLCHECHDVVTCKIRKDRYKSQCIAAGTLSAHIPPNLEDANHVLETPKVASQRSHVNPSQWAVGGPAK